MTTTSELVGKGVGKLNSFFGGPTWLGRVNAVTLDMADDGDCVLGQLFGDFQTGQAALGCDDDSASAYGFLSDVTNGVTSGQLNDEWAKRIRRLRQPAEGDEVIVSYLTTYKPGMYSNSQTFSPFSLRSLVVARAKATPEPGDRVREELTHRYGSVLKPAKGGVTTPNGSVRVVWDGGIITNVPTPQVAVVSV